MSRFQLYSPRTTAEELILLDYHQLAIKHALTLHELSMIWHCYEQQVKNMPVGAQLTEAVIAPKLLSTTIQPEATD